MLQTRLYELEEKARSMSVPNDDPRVQELEARTSQMTVSDPDPTTDSAYDVLSPIPAEGTMLEGAFSAYDLGADSHNPVDYVFQPIIPSNMYSTLPSDQTLFSDDVLKYLVHTFFLDIVPTWFPNPIHQATFMARWPNHPPLLIYSMCAAAARRSDHPVTRAYVASRAVPLYLGGEPYFWKAREIINSFVGDPDFETVLALVTLGLAMSGMGNLDASVPLMSMAIQTALSLRLDVDPDVEEVHGQLTWLQKESRRRLWWTLCMYDRQPKPGLESPDEQRIQPMINDQARPSVDQFTFFGTASRTVQVPAPEPLWLSVTDPDGLPVLESFVPGLDIDFIDLSGRLARVFYKIQSLYDSTHGSQATSPDSLLSSPVSLVESEALLVIELTAIMGALPAWARTIDTYNEFSPHITSRPPLPPYHLLTHHIIHHALHVCLRLPTVLAAADSLKYKTDLTPYILSSYNHCRYHASRVAYLLRKIVAVNPTARWIDWYTLYLAFRSALVLVVALNAETDTDELVRARKDLEIHLEVMRSVGRHMWFGNYMTKMFESIIMEA
ncbi:hypothetical protein SpCBS45565_g07686 [Spizellomyces sp. 'palustris']|nr:hypothetical protein SpCBS45565_g07686 [Spizellomyces sp. 'palustris']